jgi:hypothetical protein
MLLALSWGCNGVGASSAEGDAGPPPPLPHRSILPEGAAPTGGGILSEILGEPGAIRDKDAEAFAMRYPEAAFRDGDLATVIDATYWAHKRCRIGVFPCSDLASTPRRVGALVPLVPSEDLRPKGMERAAFEQTVAPTLTRLDPANLPADEAELPYSPRRGEALLRFRDHHGMQRFLLLVRTGETWKVVFVGGKDALYDLGG